MLQPNDQYPTPLEGPIRIDVRSVVGQRLGNKARYIPSFVLDWLERFICQERLNQLLRSCWPLRGAEFCRAVLEEMSVKYTVRYAERLASPDERVLYVANHPLGGLDGIILTDMLSRSIGPDGKRGGIKFIVNDLLEAVEPLREVFVPVNKYGQQQREAVEGVATLFDSKDSVVMFPAGLVSRRNSKGEIRDLKWQKMFVNRAVRSGRDIIPLHFIGQNSTFFYNFANLRKRLGLRFNFEMLRLPAELVAAEGKTFEIVVGECIPHTSLKGGKDADMQAQKLREMIYNTI